MPFEFTILDMLQGFRTPSLDNFILLITSLANYVWYVLIIGLLLNKPTRKLGVILVVAMILQYLVNGGILKNLFARVRPCNVDTTVELLIKRPKGFSFLSYLYVHFPTDVLAGALCGFLIGYGVLRAFDLKK